MIGTRKVDFNEKKERLLERINGKEEFLMDSMLDTHGEFPDLNDAVEGFKKDHKNTKKFFEGKF